MFGGLHKVKFKIGDDVPMTQILINLPKEYNNIVKLRKIRGVIM